MRNYSLWVLALIVGGSSAQMVKSGMTMTTTAPQNIASKQEISSAAFRDGSYLGKLATERGDAPHVDSKKPTFFVTVLGLGYKFSP